MVDRRRSERPDIVEPVDEDVDLDDVAIEEVDELDVLEEVDDIDDIEIVEEVEGAPDLCLASHFEYGTRAGYWRIADLLDRFGVKATFSASGRALEKSPWLARDAIARGHEVSCHGYRWTRHAQ
ncbi:MAG: polysaccharide deacetylase family protein, partial [Proteobacteria bacterium]|nr:polysaccharide deacetylase family protein [Pseudomonadota bacterium]